MEVHAHTHTPRKKWTHYFWEFLMLFLAVFCGFLAEYQLEHKIEKDREKQFIKSYREDLCKDTLILRIGIETMKRISSAGDTLVRLINLGLYRTPDEIKKLYSYNISSLSGFGIRLTDRTETQLKNSGAMRLLKRRKAIDGIIEYWSGIADLTNIENGLEDLRVKAREKSYQIFENKFYSDSVVNGIRVVLDNPELMTTNNFIIKEFGNRLAHIRNLMKGTYTRYLKAQMGKADLLIKVFDKEYHLK